MLRRALVIVGLVSSCQANATADPTWEYWGTSDDASWYTLKGSLEYSSGIAKIWGLKDLKKSLRAADGTQYKSLRIRYEYDCSAKSEKASYIKGYSEQMGYGVEVFTTYVGHDDRPTFYSPSDWEARGYSKYCKRSWEIWK
jgi:hypothetical protein